MLDHPGYFMCEHCEACVSRLVYHDCAEGKAWLRAKAKEMASDEALRKDLQSLWDADMRRKLDAAAAKKVETAHRKMAPVGTWR